MLINYWAWMTLTAWTGTAMALVISANVKSERAALTAVPLLLVPQMLLAGALVPYREMNRGLFKNASAIREKGGIPAPAHFMPLRYAYEGMIITQATQNPFELERIRLQRRLDRVRYLNKSLSEREIERFEITKEGLRHLLASGACNLNEATDIVDRIRRAATTGSKMEIETMKIWPDDEKSARPASDFFVNERIDLMVREAETFRSDYRNESLRNVFLALYKPLPWATESSTDLKTVKPEPVGTIDTARYCAIFLGGLSIICIYLTIFSVSRQNRQTR
jgi:hypothetical protein